MDHFCDWFQKLIPFGKGVNMLHSYFHMAIVIYTWLYFFIISSFVDITGDPEKSRLELFAQTNNSLAGNPFSVLTLDKTPAKTDTVESDSASEPDESVFSCSAFDNHQFAELEQRYVAIL